jgi:hypothetical protein
MENRVIEIEDLQVGDEILISCQSHFKYLRVLRPLTMSKTKLHWTTQQPLYKSVKCSTKQEVVTVTHTWNGNPYTRTHKEWKVTPEDHNTTLHVDLYGKQIWLVKRETI